MGVEFRGADRLMSKIRAIPKVMEDAVFEATFDIVDETVARATSHLQSSIKYGSGELSGSPKQEVVIDGKGKIIGRVWSDKSLVQVQSEQSHQKICRLELILFILLNGGLFLYTKHLLTLRWYTVFQE